MDLPVDGSTRAAAQRLRQALHSCGRAGLEEKLAAKVAK